MFLILVSITKDAYICIVILKQSFLPLKKKLNTY